MRAAHFLNDERVLAFCAGVVFSMPVLASLKRWLPLHDPARSVLFDSSKLAALVLLGVASAMRLSSGTYNPFIYFRF